MKEELYDLADHIARSKGALPLVWQDWASEIEMAIRKLANREAQPVGRAEITKIASELVRGDYLSKLWTEAEKSRHVDTHRLQNLLDELHDVMKVKAIAITRLLTTPPAPANAQIAGYFVRHRSAWDRPSKWRLWTECSAEDYAEFCKIIASGDADAGRFYEARILYDAPPAPAGPDKPRLPPHVYRDLLDMLQEAAIAYGGTQQLRAQLSSALSIHVQPDHPHTRAAMLAQPVSSGYKLNSPVIPDGWVACSEQMPEEGDVVLVCQEGGIIYCAEMQDGELYPDEFPRVPSEGREITHWMPLPAAPEGGNGA
ncbi:DUF551 domain-containing protein [Serratia marcescens]|nr:DUF551 domain-containing protein [Serratia marcescens]